MTSDLPPGVLNLVNGGRDVVNALLDHPAVRSVSFVGSSAVARGLRASGGGGEARAMSGRREEPGGDSAGR